MDYSKSLLDICIGFSWLDICVGLFEELFGYFLGFSWFSFMDYIFLGC